MLLVLTRLKLKQDKEARTFSKLLRFSVASTQDPLLSLKLMDRIFGTQLSLPQLVQLLIAFLS
jgi:hypothetical protein